MMKVLIIRSGAIGDVVHTTNIFRAIKNKYPNSDIHYLTTAVPSLLLENDKDLNKVWVFDAKRIKSYKYLYDFSKQLKQERFDVVINLQPSLRMSVFTWMIGADKTLTYKKTFKFHAVENFFMTAKKYFKDIELPENLTLYTNENIEQELSEALAHLKRPLVAFNAGGLHAKRKGRTYPVGKWLELGKLLNEKYGAMIILTGSKDDINDLKELNQMKFAHSFIGQLDILQNAVLIKSCDLMVSGDSGPLHIASAVGTKCIGLFGSMPVNRTGAYGDGCYSVVSELDCAPCNRRNCKFLQKGEIYTQCMDSIAPETIVELIATKGLLIK